jgi:hypothetical protein
MKEKEKSLDLLFSLEKTEDELKLILDQTRWLISNKKESPFQV